MFGLQKGRLQETFSNRNRPMDRPRTTLAEYTRIYLRSLECPVIVAETPPGEDDRDHFAAHVAAGMKRAQLVLVPRDPSIA
jgi:hypothetical protein